VPRIARIRARSRSTGRIQPPNASFLCTQTGTGTSSAERNYASITQRGASMTASVTQNGLDNTVYVTQR